MPKQSARAPRAAACRSRSCRSSVRRATARRAPSPTPVRAAGAGKVGSTKHLPPTFGIQYQFRPATAFRPYVGLGINYTTFFSEQGAGPVTSLALDDSFGLAWQVGADIGDWDGWFLNIDLRRIDISTRATTNLGNFDVTLDPTVIGISVGTTF